MHQGAGTRIKVCGFMRPEDARDAFGAGVRAFGVVLAPLSRQVMLEQAAEIFAVLPPGAMRIGVFADASPEEVAEAVNRLGLNLVQLQGSESPEYCIKLGVPVMKAFRVGPDFNPSVAEPYRGAVTSALVVASGEDDTDRAGERLSWQQIAERMPRIAPVTLSGGLRPENVGEAIRQVRPFSVDVCSGIEASPGVKDVGLIAEFIAAVEAADRKETDV